MVQASTLKAWGMFIAIAGVAAIAYLPALHGGFLFDDFANLPALGAAGPVDNWPTFWRYLSSGVADPTGRPLTLLSFLLDAHDWPADPFPFKRTNLILHLCNGALLYALLARLGEAIGYSGWRNRYAAVLGAAIWLLHPLFVSTTMYVVQREAMLPATTVLCGLLLWLHGRARLASGQVRSGIVWSLAGLGGFTLLGVLAKANGALLPIYALLIDSVLNRVQPVPPKLNAEYSVPHRRFMQVFGWMPAAAIGIYLLWVAIGGMLHGVPYGRPWTYGQRLLTEPRVLTDYLSLLWVPRASSTGLFNDQYQASVSLLDPISTLPALIFVLLLAGAAWRLRGRYPAVAIAVLFYFGGQLLESTSLPLELYFEHRNYVPAMLMFWPVALWLSEPSQLPVAKRILSVVLLAGLAMLTHARATVWGDVAMQGEIWGRINPASPRAQANAAQIEMQRGQVARAINRLTPLLDAHPEQTQLALNLIAARCLANGVRPSDLAAAERAMRQTGNTGTLFSHWFDRTLPAASNGSCRGLDLDALSALIAAGLQNPKLGHGGPRQDLLYAQGRIALARKQPQVALDTFMAALRESIRPGFALQAAAILGSAGHPAEGVRLLDEYRRIQSRAILPRWGMPRLHEWILARQNYWPSEVARLRHQLVLDATRNSPNTVPSSR